MAKVKETENVTGLETVENRKEAEYDLVQALLMAGEYATADESITEVAIKRGGKFLFAVNIHPIGDQDLRLARKKSTPMKKNKHGRNLPDQSGEIDNVMFKSWVIYLATTEEDQVKIWGNRTVMQRFQCAMPVECIDALLTAGEKAKLFNEILVISGLDDDDDEEEMDMETFQSSAD